MSVSRRVIRDLWRVAAKQHAKKGRAEEAESARTTAKLWGDGIVRNWRGKKIWDD